MEDLEEWEFISHDAFLGDEDTAIFLGDHDKDSSITTVFMMNHFAHSSQKSRNAAEYSVMPNQKHNHDEAPDEVMKENILHKSSLINTGIEPEDTKQQHTNIKQDDRESNVLEGTKGAKVLCNNTLGGLLAICSFAAAAIICIVFLRKRWPHDQKLRLHICTGDGEVCK